MKNQDERITKDSIIADVLKKNEALAEVFITYGLYCVGCPASGMDTVEGGAKMHGLDDSVIKEMVKRLNEVALTKE
jgi:hybrid cluster-associated redox disulfide protein